MRKCAVALIWTLALCGIAGASIIPSTPTVNALGGGVYSWSYNINLQAGETLSSTVPSGSPSGDYFTIYDIQGYHGGVSAPTGWTYTVQLIGVTPSTQNISDNASLENVTFFYIGSSSIVGTGQNIGSFVFDSTSGVMKTSGIFTAETENSHGGVDQENGPIDVPSGAPEPASLGLMGGSLIGLGLLTKSLRTARK